MKTTAVGPPRALVCAPLPPEYDKESGSRRIYHMIDMLRAEGWLVAFVCENAPADSPHVRHLRQLGVPVYVGFEGQTPELIETGAFDVAIFGFWYMARRYADLVRRLSPSTRIIVETVDLHWLRKARRLLAPSDGTPGHLDDEFAAGIVAEINAYAGADGVLTVSEKEAAIVNDLTGDPTLAHAVPDFDEMEAGEASFGARRGILFVGNFRHPPNLDAVEYFCEDVLPLLPPALRREHPVSIVGNGPGERVHELAGYSPGVRVVGWVPSLVPYLHAARVSVVPLRYGAGTKRKLIQALLAGTPTVTTRVGTEGLDLVDGEHVLVAEDASSFAGALERLVTDEDLWSHLAKQGREKMLATHGRQAARSRLLAAVEQVVGRPPRYPPSSPEAEPDSGPSASDALTRIVEEFVPIGASVLIVSKGDPDLVDMPRLRARHFPSSGNGGYAGYHPRDSSDAIRHLDDVKDDAQYLVFPAASAWWLDYYVEFARHLASDHERICDREECVIFRLGRRGAEFAEPASVPTDPAQGGARRSDPPRRSRTDEWAATGLAARDESSA